MMIDLDKIATERRSEASRRIDTVTTEDLVRIINDADKAVAAAVEKILPAVAAVIDKTAVRIRAGGRLIYVGAGTSGRLGVLDAAECPPTYNTPPELVQALIAGGKEAMFRAVEGEEDKPQQGAADIRTLSLTATDTVIGLSASGRTPYVIGALVCAKELGAYTVSVTSSPGSKLAAVADRDLCALTGPEVVAGTAEKMILNMISTGVMIRLGKVYGNLMVDVKATNEKLAERAVRIVISATARDRAEAEAALTACGGKAKTAIVMLLRHLSADAAEEALLKNKGHIRPTIEDTRHEL